MKVKILICLVSILIFGCRVANYDKTRHVQPKNQNTSDMVDSSFNYRRYEKEGDSYLEKYSEAIWNKKLADIVYSSTVKANVNSIIMKTDSTIFNLEYMRRSGATPGRHHTWLVENGRIEDLEGCFGFGSYQGGISDVFKDIPECIIEYYEWRLKSGEYVRTVYLRKGKELIPVTGWWFPADFIFPE